MRFEEKVIDALSGPLRAGGIDVLQANLGYRCNMSCKHCHIDAGPGRAKSMGKETAGAILSVLENTDIRVLDLTGGAPELNPNFRYLVAGAHNMGRQVIVRTNLSIFFETGMENLPEFFVDNNVEVIASLPYYIEETVDSVRGKGAFEKSIRALRKLNELGYGSSRILNLVYNPPGAYLPAAQAELEEEYKRELKKRFGVAFSGLYAFTNMPLGRFREFLVRSGQLEKYMERLVASFNPATFESVMCQKILSVSWDGTLYDCDFNQAVGLQVNSGSPRHIGEFEYEMLSNRQIEVGEHCFGCTAGRGST
jgi:radical SAM/Cys-rich protein